MGIPHEKGSPGDGSGETGWIERAADHSDRVCMREVCKINNSSVSQDYSSEFFDSKASFTLWHVVNHLACMNSTDSSVTSYSCIFMLNGCP